MFSVIIALTGTVKEREREVQVSDPCLASNRLIDSSWNLQRDSSIPKAKSVGQYSRLVLDLQVMPRVDKLGTVSLCREKH